MTQDFLWFLKQDFAKMVHFSEIFFSWIYKYLNGHVLCLQFFFRCSLEFSWGQYLMKKWQKGGPKKSLNENENQKTVNTIHDHQDTCEFQKKTFSEKCTILAKSCFKNHQKSWFFRLVSSKIGTKKNRKILGWLF